MTPSLTIVYITSRPAPCLNWFFDSLYKQYKTGNGPKVIVVDASLTSNKVESADAIYTRPKPTVWQGDHRLTKEEWWAASNARNTGICLCKTDWVAFVDDRCVLAPTWLQAVRDAMAGNYAVFGSYEKRHGMTVEDGIIKHGGIIQATDSRHDYATKFWNNETPHDCPGEWAFGCTLALPLEWMLQINGYDETCDGLSMEDVLAGLMLQNNGYPMKFDYRMKIIEDRTPEHLGPAMVRKDAGVSPNDKSHALLNMLKDKKASTHPINIRQIRQDVLAGNPWPAPWGPTHCFFTSKPITEL